MNSLNYYSPLISHSFTRDNYKILEIRTRTLDNDPSFKSIQFLQSYKTTIGFVWGMQRNYNNRFSLDLSTGLGLNFIDGLITDSDGSVATIRDLTLTPIIQISLGVWLNKVK